MVFKKQKQNNTLQNNNVLQKHLYFLFLWARVELTSRKH